MPPATLKTWNGLAPGGGLASRLPKSNFMNLCLPGGLWGGQDASHFLFVGEVLRAQVIPFEEQVVRCYRAPRVIVHGRDGSDFLPVQVPFVLYVECVGSGPYVGKDGALHPPPYPVQPASSILGGVFLSPPSCI